MNLLELPKLAEVVKLLAPRVLIAIAVSCAVVLFLPSPALGRIGLLTLRESRRGELGGALVVSVALLLADATSSAWKDWAQKRGMWRELKRLTPDEKDVLRRYLEEDTGTISWSVESGVVNGLQAKRILYRASEISDASLIFPYNLQPWARDRLRKKPGLVGLEEADVGRKRKPPRRRT
jgi:Super-infection exclusion protein B